MDLRKLSYCECVVYAAHHSHSLGVHPCISFTRTRDFAGDIFLHSLNDIVSKHCTTRMDIREGLKLHCYRLSNGIPTCM